jgi:arylsulfatase A-like enzyme
MRLLPAFADRRGKKTTRIFLATLAIAALWQYDDRMRAQPPARTHLVIVVDGLRPDYVTADVMPRLTRLGARGIVFTAHHSVFPTVTRVNASSFVTGAYPETHGLLGNDIYIPSVNPVRALDTGERANLEAVARAEGQLLTAPSLGEILSRGGKKLLGVSSGSTGSSLLLNHTVGTGAVIHTDYTLPPELGPRVLAALGPAPPHATPNDAQNQRAIDGYLKVGLELLHPDVTILWLNDPDGTAHASGIGSGLTTRSLSLVDAGIGRIEDTLRAEGRLDQTNIIVTSDHGFSTQTGTLKLGSLVGPFARTLPDGSPDVVVAEGAIYLRSRDDPTRLPKIVAALQKRPEVGAIFTRPRREARNAATSEPAGGAPFEGIVPGTLSFDTARWNHPRSGDILVSANWTHDRNDAGFAGKTTQEGVAGHGTSSPYDIHNTLIAAGPDFRERTTSAVPTSNVDIAPTLLHLLGMPAPPTMTGRVIQEGLRAGPADAAIRVERVSETVKTPDGGYELTAHTSIVEGRRYLDYTEVLRH